MIFQPTILNDETFAVHVNYMTPFPMHWHSDIEIMYCLNGSFGVRMRKSEYIIREGDLIFVGSCEPHEIFDSTPTATVLLISVGSLFCGSENFKKIVKNRFENSVLKQDEQVKAEISSLMLLIKGTHDVKCALELRGRLYMFITQLLGKIKSTSQLSENHQKRLMTIMKIQKALDLVSTRYNEDITLDDVAAVSGYEKSAFCRMFKNATNYTFHKYLNDYRIKKATILLEENNCSIADVAFQVGFVQQKNFCRLFKESMGITPTEYRKMHV